MDLKRPDREFDFDARQQSAEPGHIVDLAQLPVSLSGGAASSIRPDAVLARGSRITGSGGASYAPLHVDQSGNQTVFVLPHGTTLSFTDLADFRPLSFP